jgi:hypothetical protein
VESAAKIFKSEFERSKLDRLNGVENLKVDGIMNLIDELGVEMQ